MKLLSALLAGLAIAVLAFGAWVRLAPHEAARFHRAGPALPLGNHASPGGFHAVRPWAAFAGTPQTALARVEEVIRATPRTPRLAGSPTEGHFSYVTRSALWGFPDTTNVWIEGEALHISGHLRFGQSDLGVNRARIEGWLSALGS